MKKLVTFLFFSSVLFTTALKAQGQIELYGLRSWALPRPEFAEKGWGAGINYLCRPLALNGKDNAHPLDFQIGGQFYMTGLGHHTLRGIPLAEPQIGNAKVRFNNDVMGADLFFRFSMPNATTGFTPYVDFLGGGRMMTSQMTIFPDYVPAGYDQSTNSEVMSLGGWNYGIGVGLQKKLSENARLDCELIWSHSDVSDNLVNLASVQKGGDGVIYNVKKSPNDVLLLKVGFNFTIQHQPRSQNCNSGWHSSSNNTYYQRSGPTYQGHSNSVHVNSGGGAHPRPTGGGAPR